MLSFQGWNPLLVHCLESCWEVWISVKSLLILTVRNSNIFYTYYMILFVLDGLDAVCLNILTRMLYPRGIGKGAIFLKEIEVIQIVIYGCAV